MTTFLFGILALTCGIWLTHTLVILYEKKWEREATRDEMRLAIHARYAAVAEREVAIRERLPEQPVGREPMPADLEAKVNAWEDEFAREDERKYVEQLYAESGDWNAVRRAYAPPLADNQPVPQ